jgi:hypothetical protein
MCVLTELNPHAYQRLHQKLIIQITLKQRQLNNKMKDPVKYPPIFEKKL